MVLFLSQNINNHFSNTHLKYLHILLCCRRFWDFRNLIFSFILNTLHLHFLFTLYVRFVSKTTELFQFEKLVWDSLLNWNVIFWVKYDTHCATYCLLRFENLDLYGSFPLLHDLASNFHSKKLDSHFWTNISDFNGSPVWKDEPTFYSNQKLRSQKMVSFHILCNL